MNNIDKVSDIMSHKVIDSCADDAEERSNVEVREISAVDAGEICNVEVGEFCADEAKKYRADEANGDFPNGVKNPSLSREEQAATALEAQGIKPTAMRILVYLAIARARHPVSLKDLEESMVTADRSTIFRTLTLMHDNHVIHAIEDGSGAMKYELCHSDKAHDADEDQHPHFYCESCRRTFCLHDVPIPEVSLPRGYLATAWNFLIKGTCAECLARGWHKH